MPSPSTAIVVGGGPAGLIAAEVLATAGVRVEVTEHRRSVGRKLLLAGRGGLNITNDADLDSVLAVYHGNCEPVTKAIRAFPPHALRQWCQDLGEPTFAGNSGHVFPASFRATPLLRSWLRRLDDLGVTITTGCAWTGWDGHQVMQFDDGTTRRPDVAVLALGGASWPRTGSDGTWVPHMRSGGHAVNDLVPSNAGVIRRWSDLHRTRFAGSPLKNVVVRAGSTTARGDIVVTDSGLEGPPIYAVGPELRTGVGHITLDLRPDHDLGRLTRRLIGTRREKDSTATWLRRAGFDPATISLLREATDNNIPRDPDTLAGLCKHLTLSVAGLGSIDRAISTAGGVACSEITDAFMLRDRPGTFVAGEMLDWDAPTGGYLLQACFSTGVAAAKGALAHLRSAEPTPKPIDQRPQRHEEEP